jgi:thiamine biosynthesis lipoprotein
MGVDARIVVYAPDRPSAEAACAAAFARIAALDSMMSDYRRDSELMRLCARAGGQAARVSPDLFLVLRRAQEVARNSGGAFDITAGPLIALWRTARKAAVLPDSAKLRRARRLVGWRKLQLDASARTARLTVRGMKLDLGGIAKGYAADAAQRVLKEHGISRALVELGGDIVVSGPPPGTDGWTIRVPTGGTALSPLGAWLSAPGKGVGVSPGAGTAPVPTGSRAPSAESYALLRFTHCAISTSGDTEQFAVIGGRRYSHVVDPRTGQALTNRVQATLVAPDGLTADPLSTALCVLDEPGRQRLLAAYPDTTASVRALALD